MRYLYWDVLLFPEQSRVPLQEFRTTCHVTYDPVTDSVGTRTTSASRPPMANPVAQRQLPVVTCFVPSLQYGCPFRVSLHSWQEPEGRRGTAALASCTESVCFEARVFLDGLYAGSIVLNKHATWPQVIDTCSSTSFLPNLASEGRLFSTPVETDKTGQQQCLRFPPFHQQLLVQDWWSPGEDIGRVKVVISEGLASNQEPPSGFRKVKNIVAFSFQHAPLAALEEAGVAWPNAGMWHPVSRPLYAPPSPCKEAAVAVEAHAHSPRQRDGSSGYKTNVAATMVAPRMLMHPPMPPPGRRSMMLSDSGWKSNPHLQDPFFEQHRHQVGRQWGTRVSTSDDSMPDYSHSITPRSSRDASFHDMQEVHGVSVVPHESQFEELMAAFSPVKSQGTQAPPTTRVSSASKSPPTEFRTLSGSKAQAESFHGQARSVSMTTREGLARPGREVSDMSMQSRFSDKSRISEQQASEGEGGLPQVRRTPAEEVKGRKEGVLAAPSRQMGTVRRRRKSPTSNGDESFACTSEGKRKREGMSAMSDLPSEQSEGAVSSPSGKGSKKMCQDSARTNAQDDSARAPLSTLENIQ